MRFCTAPGTIGAGQIASKSVSIRVDPGPTRHWSHVARHCHSSLPLINPTLATTKSGFGIRPRKATNASLPRSSNRASGKRCEMDKRSAAHAENWEVRVNGASWRTEIRAKGRPARFRPRWKVLCKSPPNAASSRPFLPWRTPHEFVLYFRLSTSYFETASVSGRLLRIRSPNEKRVGTEMDCDFAGQGW